METRTIRLEILRHGPAHNQLLSPLTPYLALCGNNDAEPVKVQLEHAELVQKLRELGEDDGRKRGQARLDEASAEVTRMLGSIRSLTAELAAARADNRLVHLRLVLSAAELALLPFELVNAPLGIPGQGQRLTLQMISPVVLTREVRRVSTATIRWPERPRILVAAATPEGVADVPLCQLLLAIRQALAPWIAAGEGQSVVSVVAEHLSVLPNASLNDIHEACANAEPPFTHVHILAHGIAIPSADGTGSRYGLALHAEDDRASLDPVDGERLAAAIRCYRSGPKAELTTPAVVTLASCESGNVGSVITPGASIAHHLHEAGIPFVLASQFPLSFRASAILARTLYDGLLWGHDPLVIAHKLRQELRIRCPDTHDWASLVVYAALPADLDRQLPEAAFQRRRLAVDAAMARASSLREGGDQEGAQRSLEEAMGWLEDSLPKEGSIEDGLRRSRAFGVLASVRKRWAHILHDREHAEGTATEERDRLRREIQRALSLARDHYLDAYRLDTRAAWALVQHLALAVALGDALDPRRWATARVLAEEESSSDERQRIVWGHASLAELAVLAQRLPDAHEAQRDAPTQARAHIERLLDKAGARSLDAYSVKRQMIRYASWWWKHARERELPLLLVELLDQRGVPSQWRQA